MMTDFSKKQREERNNFRRRLSAFDAQQEGAERDYDGNYKFKDNDIQQQWLGWKSRSLFDPALKAAEAANKQLTEENARLRGLLQEARHLDDYAGDEWSYRILKLQDMVDKCSKKISAIHARIDAELGERK